MNYKFTSRDAFTALVAAFILHNIEEAITICQYPVENPVSFIQPASCRQFLWAVSVLSIAGIVAYLLAMQSGKTAVYLFISTALAATLLLNVFVPHIFIAIYTFKYTPGLVSAILLNFPISLIVIIQNRKQYNTNAQFVKHAISGLLIGYLIFAVVMKLVLLLV